MPIPAFCEADTKGTAVPYVEPPPVTLARALVKPGGVEVVPLWGEIVAALEELSRANALAF